MRRPTRTNISEESEIAPRPVFQIRSLVFVDVAEACEAGRGGRQTELGARGQHGPRGETSVTDESGLEVRSRFAHYALNRARNLND